jgi:hypothetical protein
MLPKLSLSATLVVSLLAGLSFLGFQNCARPLQRTETESSPGRQAGREGQDIDPSERVLLHDLPPLKFKSSSMVETELNQLKQAFREKLGSQSVGCSLPPNVHPSVDCRFPIVPVDHSASPHFPPIGDQGLIGSCQSWATAYGVSYNRAKQNSWNIRGGSLDKICSPGFLYFLGVPFSSVRHHGCAPASLYPYNADAPYLAPSLRAFKEALSFRQDIPFGMATLVENWSAINGLRGHLANGKVAYAFMQIDSVFNNLWRSGGSEAVVTQNSNSLGGHAALIVGYDDRKSYWVNGVRKYGAFLFANSWGRAGAQNTLGESGFFWFGYEALASAQLGLSYLPFEGPLLPPPSLMATAKVNAHSTGLFDRSLGAGFANDYFYRIGQIANASSLEIAFSLDSRVVQSANGSEVRVIGGEGPDALPENLQVLGRLFETSFPAADELRIFLPGSPMTTTTVTTSPITTSTTQIIGNRLDEKIHVRNMSIDVVEEYP